MRLFFLFVLYCSTFFYATQTHAQDVYNFYFQKNSPQNINGTATPSTPQATNENKLVDEKVNSEKLANKALPESDTFRRFEIGLARAHSTMTENYDDGWQQPKGGNGFGLQGAYRFNKYVSLDGMVNIVTLEGDRYTKYKNYIQGNLGVLVTPIHINIFGYELFEIGVSSGVMSGKRANRDNSGNIEDTESSYGPYLGGRLAINLTPSLAIYGDLKGMLNTINKETKMYQVGLKYRF